MLRLAGTVLCCSSLSSAAAAQLSFTDATAGAGLSNVFEIPVGSFANTNYVSGGAVGDFNGDGWQDLFVPSDGEGGTPNKLYLADGAGGFTDQAAAWGIDEVHFGKGVSVCDYDDDGDVDIYLTSSGSPGNVGPGRHRLYRNEGTSFTNVALAAGVATAHPSLEDGWGSTWGDYDRDGDLDLFVAGVQMSNNEGSRLFRQESDNTFTDVTAAAGIFAGVTAPMHHFAPAFCDFDGDGWLDLLMVSDFGTSEYVRNLGDGTFALMTAASGFGAEENGMGQCLGDFDNDLRIDAYVTSIHLPSIDWTGNKLYLNQGDHVMLEVAEQAGVADGGYGWGAVACDFDHDGDLDLAETNGGLFAIFQGEASYLWLNDGTANFTEVGAATGFVHTDEGRAMVHLDHGNDGDQDVVIFSYAGPMMLLENQLSGPDRHWLRVFLDDGTDPLVPPHGIGSRVLVTTGGATQLRVVLAADHYLGHSELSAHFGLGAATLVDRLRVEWPSGAVTEWYDVAADQTLTLSPDDPGTFRFDEFCFGDGGVQPGCTDCPCANELSGTSGGCLNSVGASARLRASGAPSLTNDSLRIELDGGTPSTFGVLTSGASRAPANPANPCFGLDSGLQAAALDGLRCVVSGVLRHGARPTDAAGSIGVTTPGFGPPNGPAIGLVAHAGLALGETRHFQIVYRDDPALSCQRGQNTTQGVSLTVIP